MTDATPNEDTRFFGMHPLGWMYITVLAGLFVMLLSAFDWGGFFWLLGQIWNAIA